MRAGRDGRVGLGVRRGAGRDQDTFINSAAADNNDGASPSLYTGHNGMGGAMRALVRFAIPAAWQGRVTVTRAVLATVTRGTGNDETTVPTPATESLQALAAAWTEGSGFGDSSMMNTVGQACGTSGATWNQPNCAGGTPWSGGSVAATVSGVATVPATLEATVTWDSATAGNAGMLADVQSWIDSPAGNQGWRIASSTEAAGTGQAQRFYSREVAGKGPDPVDHRHVPRRVRGGRRGLRAAGSADSGAATAAPSTAARARERRPPAPDARAASALPKGEAPACSSPRLACSSLRRVRRPAARGGVAIAPGARAVQAQSGQPGDDQPFDGRVERVDPGLGRKHAQLCVARVERRRSLPAAAGRAPRFAAPSRPGPSGPAPAASPRWFGANAGHQAVTAAHPSRWWRTSSLRIRSSAARARGSRAARRPARNSASEIVSPIATSTSASADARWVGSASGASRACTGPAS